jgi:tryptophanyl-tRNA synthetase
MEEPKEPEGDHLFQLYQLMASETEIAEMAALYRKGGFGYGQIKTALADAAQKYFQPARDRRTELEQNPDLVSDILADGAKRARAQAAEVLARAEAACGISR